MKILGRTMAVMGLISVGYFLGTLEMFSPKNVRAQPAVGEKSTKDKVKDAQKAVDNAQRALLTDKTYQPVINGINAFATTVGGVDALKDLEEGRGVDPETFAGLYAGQILSKHEMHLDKNANGQLTYKGKVIRMYSIDRLKKLYAKRVEIQESKKTIN
jgi:hypothetical protein